MLLIVSFIKLPNFVPLGGGWDNAQSAQQGGWDQGGGGGGSQGGWSQGGGGVGRGGGGQGVAKTTYYNKKTSIWPVDKGNQGSWDNNQSGWANSQSNNPSGGWDDAPTNKGTSSNIFNSVLINTDGLVTTELILTVKLY